MTSIVNLFSNFNDLTKPKSVTDNVTEYKTNANSCNEPSPSLSQGKKFKKYQGKIVNNLEKRIKKSDLVEGFEGLKDLDLNKNGLTQQTNNLLNKNDFTTQQQTLSNLKNDYQNTLNEYQTLMSKISGNTTNYIDRVNPNNPYLGKVIQLQGGYFFYVTNQGVAKYISQPDVYNQVSGKNGFPPSGQFTTLSISWDDSYNSPGATIPTKPPLITGTPVEIGESVGNEGVNVFVNSVVKNPQSSYVGCYNNIPASTEIMFVPKMNSSNSVNGYNSYASSVYQNNNDFTGPWCAFDQNIDTWWHTEVSSATNYNSTTGVYEGTTQLPFTNSSGVQTTVKGEYLHINLPGVNTPNSTNIPLTRYEIQGRPNSLSRDPNTWYILGWMPSGGWQQIDYQSNIQFNFKMLSFNVSNPKPCSAYLILTTVVGDPGDKSGNRYCLQIATWNLYTSSNYVSNPKSAMTNIGSMGFDQCQNYAVNSGNQYFGLQGVDGNGNGNCMISNDLAGSQINGQAVNYNTTALWDSKTYGNNPGSTATLTRAGTLSVLNANGSAIFSTPGDTNSAGGYIGCYGDTGDRAMPNTSNDQYLPMDQCRQLAIDNNLAYYGTQNSSSDIGWCSGTNDLNSAKKYGLANNCNKNSQGKEMGGPWSNAVYSVNQEGSYYLYLQDDGNMCVYRGQGPSDYQGGIWCSQTNGKQQQPNPNFAAAKGKFGQCWIPSGSTLSPGDFIGSTDGSIYLIMQSDGNLVLYTTTSSSKCSSSGGNKTVGAQDANALYQITAMGNKNSIGKLAFIDQNSQSHSYPNTNIQYSKNYTSYTGIDSAGYDIPGAAYGNATVEQCQSTCDSNQECAGFAFSDNVCYPKTSSMFPNGAQQVNSRVNLYTRNKEPIAPPIGVPGTVVNVDTIMYDNYKDGGDIGSEYGLANATSTQKQQIEQLQSKLNMLTSQINGYTNKFSSGTDSLNNQSSKNMEGLGDYLKDYKKTNTTIKNFNTNIENILNDSDITVLQKNYDYLFWSILAAGTVLITMNIAKKQ